MVVRFFDIAPTLTNKENMLLAELEGDIDKQLRATRRARIEKDSLPRIVLEYLVTDYRTLGYQVKITQETSSVMVDVFVF